MMDESVTDYFHWSEWKVTWRGYSDNGSLYEDKRATTQRFQRPPYNTTAVEDHTLLFGPLKSSWFVCLLFWGGGGRVYSPLNLFWLFGAETEARRGQVPSLASETRQGIFKMRLLKDSLTHYHASITQFGCTGGKRQVKDATNARTSNLLVASRAT